MINLRDVLTGAWAAAFIAALTALATILGIVVTPPRVNQGDVVTINGRDTCTVTYIADGYLYTAGHCTRVGDTITHRTLLGSYAPVGTTTHVVDTATEDYAVIALNRGVTGTNTYATNPQPLTNVEPGDMVCHYARQTTTITCAHATTTGATTLWLPGTHTILPGDSGGPAWVPGKGLVGAVTHTGDGWRVSAGGWGLTAPHTHHHNHL